MIICLLSIDERASQHMRCDCSMKRDITRIDSNKLNDFIFLSSTTVLNTKAMKIYFVLFDWNFVLHTCSRATVTLSVEDRRD